MNFLRKALQLLPTLICMCCIYACSFFKISFILGSQKAFFNGSAVAIPLVGFFTTSTNCFLVCLVRLCQALLFTHTLSYHLLAFIVPGFCASLYWTNPGSTIRFWLPLACMIAFIAHPVGAQAFCYSFYWFIPLAIYLVGSKNLWMESLASTFVAHAVGSVIWIYTMETTPALWISLLPIVAVERALCAAGMVSICYAYRLAHRYYADTIARVQTYIHNVMHA